MNEITLLRNRCYWHVYDIEGSIAEFQWIYVSRVSLLEYDHVNMPRLQCLQSMQPLGYVKNLAVSSPMMSNRITWQLCDITSKPIVHTWLCCGLTNASIIVVSRYLDKLLSILKISAQVEYFRKLCYNQGSRIQMSTALSKCPIMVPSMGLVDTSKVTVSTAMFIDAVEMQCSS